MENREFKVLLSKAGLSKKDFAQKLKLNQQSVNNWGSSKEIPYWVKSWLENYVKLKRYEDIKEKIVQLGVLQIGEGEIM